MNRRTGWRNGWRIGYGLASALVLAIAAAACGGGPTNPSQNQVDNFTVTIVPVSGGGSGTSSPSTFVVANTGELTITVPTATPTPNNYLGLFLGNTASDGSCSGAIVNQFVAVGQAAYTNGNILKGNYCVSLSDIYGILTATTTFTIKVSHP